MAKYCAVERVLDLRLLYFGPVDAGSWTNLVQLSRGMGDGAAPVLSSDQTRHTVSMLPLDLAAGEGVQLRVEVCAIGSAEGSLESILAEADGLVFVADAQRQRLRDNLIAWADLLEAVRRSSRQMSDLAVVFQINKTDLQEAMSAGDVDAALNSESHSSFPAVATMGRGVGMCFSEVTRRAVARVAETLDLASQGVHRGALCTALDTVLIEAGSAAGRRLRDIVEKEAPSDPLEPEDVEPWSGVRRRGVDSGREVEAPAEAPVEVVEALETAQGELDSGGDDTSGTDSTTAVERSAAPMEPTAARSAKLGHGVKKSVSYLRQALSYVERRSQDDQTLVRVARDGQAVANYLERVADELASWALALEQREQELDPSRCGQEETVGS